MKKSVTDKQCHTFVLLNTQLSKMQVQNILPILFFTDFWFYLKPLYIAGNSLYSYNL